MKFEDVKTFVSAIVPPGTPEWQRAALETILSNPQEALRLVSRPPRRGMTDVLIDLKGSKRWRRPNNY